MELLLNMIFIFKDTSMKMRLKGLLLVCLIFIQIKLTEANVRYFLLLSKLLYRCLWLSVLLFVCNGSLARFFLEVLIIIFLLSLKESIEH